MQVLTQVDDARRDRRGQHRAGVGRHRGPQPTRRERRAHPAQVGVETGAQPVRARLQLEGAEDGAESRHLGPDRDLRVVRLGQRRGQLARRQAVRVLGEQQQDLAVPQAEAAGGRAVLQGRGPPPQHAQPRRGEADRERRRRRDRPQPVDPQLGLGCGHRGPDQGQGLRPGHLPTAGDVDHADHRAGVRLTDRGRRAAPRGDLPEQVLRPEELDRTAGLQGGARRVRPRAGLAPVGAGDEVHALGPGPQPRRPLDPEQLAGGVADRHQQSGLGRRLDQQPTDHRHHRGQRGGQPKGGQLLVVQPDRGDGGLRVQPAGETAAPGVGHHRPDAPRQPAGGQEVVVHASQETGQPDSVAARRHRQAVARTHAVTLGADPNLGSVLGGSGAAMGPVPHPGPGLVRMSA